jgi:hypothetical protein
VPSADTERAEERAPSRRSWSSFHARLAVVVALGALLRLVYVVASRGDAVVGDGGYYHFGANLLADGRGFLNPISFLVSDVVTPAANHPPGWTVVLAAASALGFRTWLEHQVLACLVGAATVGVVGFAARRVGGPRVGLIAAAVAAVYPNFWLYERELMSETFVLLLAALTILVTYRFLERPGPVAAVAVGAGCGALVMTRSEQGLLVVLLLVPLVLLARTVPLRRRVAWLAASVGVAGALVAPWTVHNLTRFEEPVLITTGLGPVLRVSSCDPAWYGDRLGNFDVGCYGDSFFIDGDASTADGVLRRRALRYVRAHLTRAPVVVLAREGRTFGLFAPRQQMDLDRSRGTDAWVIRAGYATYYLLAAAAVAGVVVLRRRRVAVFPLLAFVATVAFTVAIAFGQTRYRAPAEVSIVVLAAVGLDAAWRRWGLGARPADVDLSDPSGRAERGGTARGGDDRTPMTAEAGTAGDP